MSERDLIRTIIELHEADLRQLDLLGKVLALCGNLIWALGGTWLVLGAIIMYLVTHHDFS